jgi:predicted nucleic acid-binding protein
MTPSSSPKAAVIDSNVLIAICSKEPTFTIADHTLQEYAAKGFTFYAPSVIVSEALYALCNKLHSGTLTSITYDEAVENFQDQMAAILSPPHGEASLIRRAKEIRTGYGCSRSSDSIYIALAEELSGVGPTKLLTLDQALENQVKHNAPTVSVHLLV